MRLIDVDEVVITRQDYVGALTLKERLQRLLNLQPTVDAIPIEQLLSIFPKYDDYIHMKTYPYNETMEDIYSKGHEDGWNACLKFLKEELYYWEKENEID